MEQLACGQIKKGVRRLAGAPGTGRGARGGAHAAGSQQQQLSALYQQEHDQPAAAHRCMRGALTAAAAAALAAAQRRAAEQLAAHEAQGGVLRHAAAAAAQRIRVNAVQVLIQRRQSQQPRRVQRGCERQPRFDGVFSACPPPRGAPLAERLRAPAKWASRYTGPKAKLDTLQAVEHSP